MEQVQLLRFFTAGNVDDGKSTLIGRLLYDSHAISTDVIDTLSRQSKIKGGNTEIDLALLTDGLRSEREQGITIDVAYKYFITDKRKFIVADTPGHLQYTRNMFTGASNADLAIILVDARNGLTDQTKRHSIISSLLRIPHLVVCINKMDLVEYSKEKFGEIERNFRVFAKQLNLENISFIPVSALTGENVVARSEKMNWYNGKPLFEVLETIKLSEQENDAPRFQVQYVIRPQAKEFHHYIGYAGKVLSGTYKKGQEVVVFPSGMKSTIERIERDGKEIETAVTGWPVIFHLKDKLNVNRGNSIVATQNLPESEKKISATICWMDHTPFARGQKFILQHNSFITKAVIREIVCMMDIHTFTPLESEGIKLNDICKVIIETAEVVSYDSYKNNRKTGSFILVNEDTNNTVAAGTID